MRLEKLIEKVVKEDDSLKSRAISKVVSKLVMANRELKITYREIENGGDGRIGVDLLETQASAIEREIETLNFILNAIEQFSGDAS